MAPVICMTATQMLVFFAIFGLLGSNSVLFVAICIFIGSLVCFCILGHQSKMSFGRRDIWVVARWTCLWVWFGSILGYSFYFRAYPHEFSFSASQLWFIAPLISLAPALMSIILTMCAGDTALFILGKEDS